MRVSAVGWFFDTLDETERVAAISAAITHNHPEGIKGAQATAAAIWMARNGKTRRRFASILKRHTDTTFIRPMSIGTISTGGTPAAKRPYRKRLSASLIPQILRMPFAKPFLSAETAIRLHASKAE